MTKTTCRNLIVSTLLGLGITLRPGGAKAFDAAADFSSAANPNSVWSYGLSYGVGSTFLLSSISTQNYQGLSVSGWLVDQSPAGVPNVLHNGTTHSATLAVTTYQPGQLAESPGYSNEVSVIRWTAPFSGTCTVAATFTCLSAAALSVGGSVDVHILHNGVSIFDNDAVNETAPASFSGSEELLVGDTIDFAVGNGGNGPNEDTTGLSATITPTTVGNADLTISTLTMPASTITDSNVVFSILVTNRGPDNAFETTITNILPSQVDYVACSTSTNGICSAIGIGQIVGTYPLLAAGETAALVITGKVLCTTVNGAVLTNTAAVSSIAIDPVPSDNQTSVVLTNSNPLHAPSCENALAFAESFKDRVACGGNREDGIFCEEFGGDTVTISASISLRGIDISQFNGDTGFGLTVGHFSVTGSLGEDLHYAPGKTQASFSAQVINDDGDLVGRQTVRLKWTGEQLTATVSLKNADSLNSGINPILAGDYDGHTTHLINDTVAATVSLGSVSQTFDTVPVNGSVLTKTLNGRDGTPYAVSTIRLKGNGLR